MEKALTLRAMGAGGHAGGAVAAEDGVPCEEQRGCSGAGTLQVPLDSANPGIWGCIPPYAHPATLVPCTGMSPCQPFYFCLCKPLWITEERFVPCLPCCDILQHEGWLCSSKIEDFWHGVLAVGSLGWGGTGLQGVLQPPVDAWSPRAALS